MYLYCVVVELLNQLLIKTDKCAHCFIDCGRPPLLSNGIVNYTTTKLNSVAAMSCEDGYTLNGSQVLTCLHTGWNGYSICTIEGAVFQIDIHIWILVLLVKLF